MSRSAVYTKGEMAASKMKPREARKRLKEMTASPEVLCGLLELGLDMRWVMAQLKNIAENGGNNLQMSAVRQVMQLLSGAGMASEANVTSSGRLKKEPPTGEEIGDKPLTTERIDDIVQANAKTERKDNASSRVRLAQAG